MSQKKKFVSLADLQQQKTRNETAAPSTPRPGNSGDSRSVYSTEKGRLCPSCGEALESCTCSKRRAVPEGSLSIRRETAGRKGKTVTVIAEIPLAQEKVNELAKALRKHCGVGGTASDFRIELQGDQVEKCKKILQERGLI